MKNIGVWLDKEKALVITIEDGIENMKKIESNIETFHIHGGSGTRFKGGPQDVVQDSKYLEREKHQTKRYFSNLVEEVDNADSLAIFGPAETSEKFKKELETSHRELNAKVKTVQRVDSMTDNQVKALVRDFFKDEN
ncbi:hypothetical protein [Tenacibaculum caenipelagi]|uniref:Protein required for attachment to host cells n=1 Tax=Tenacibaculum caenipelagi TaxID=1325435 RepID=A0A4R6TC82_9FLAO|nr:hypothetical protein [Tenacibaculum caenipelagi]TDQ21966.1 hypothetical protein DFQ07_3063 [Tenacibaculum caenipelagi]